VQTLAQLHTQAVGVEDLRPTLALSERSLLLAHPVNEISLPAIHAEKDRVDPTAILSSVFRHRR
jgi:hypothetical protein